MKLRKRLKDLDAQLKEAEERIAEHVDHENTPSELAKNLRKIQATIKTLRKKI